MRCMDGVLKHSMYYTRRRTNLTKFHLPRNGEDSEWPREGWEEGVTGGKKNISGGTTQ